MINWSLGYLGTLECWKYKESRSNHKVFRNKNFSFANSGWSLRELKFVMKCYLWDCISSCTLTW